MNKETFLYLKMKQDDNNLEIDVQQSFIDNSDESLTYQDPEEKYSSRLRHRGGFWADEPTWPKNFILVITYTIIFASSLYFIEKAA